MLDEAPGHQALSAEGLRDRVVQSVQLPRGLGFAGHVEGLGRAALHPERELVGRDARRQIGVPRVLLHVELVEPGQQIEPRALLLGTDARRRLQIDNRIAGRAKQRALIRSRQEPRAPVVDAANRTAACIVNDHVRRQARALRAKPVGDPGAEARKPHAGLPHLHFVRRLDVIVRLAVDRSHEGNLVGVTADQGKDVRHFDPGPSVFLELKRARHQRAGMALAHDDVAADLAVERLTGVFDQGGLGIERVDVTDASAHEQGDHRGRTWLEVWRFRGVRIGPDRCGTARRAGVAAIRRQQPVLIQQVGERQSAHAAARAKEKITSRPARLARLHDERYLV